MAQVICDRRSHADQAWCGVVEKGCEPLFCAISGLPLSGGSGASVRSRGRLHGAVAYLYLIAIQGFVKVIRVRAGVISFYTILVFVTAGLGSAIVEATKIVMQTLGADGLLHCARCFATSPTDDLATCLRRQYYAFRSWCKENKITCSTRMFTPSQLRVKHDDFPFLGTKAYNTRVIIAWLADP